MTNKQVEGLLKLLSIHGVTRFKNAEVEVELGASAPSLPPSHASPPPEPAPQPSQPPAAVPRAESSIPHHVNEVSNLLKLSDNDLVEKIFPLPPGVEG